MCLRGRSLLLETEECQSDSHFHAGIPIKVSHVIDAWEKQRRERIWRFSLLPLQTRSLAAA